MKICDCKFIDERRTRVIERVERADLVGGGHTNFYLLECLQCGGAWGFPENNFRVFLDRGTEQAKTDVLRRRIVNG